MIITVNGRALLSILCGTFCLLVGLAQFLYSFLAFASIVFVDILGIGLTMASSAIAVMPEQPYEIPYAQGLANAIAVTGMALSVAGFVSAAQCFFRRSLPRISIAVCFVFCMILAGFHLMHSLSYGGLIYLVAAVTFSGMVFAERAICRATNTRGRTTTVHVRTVAVG